MSTICKYGFLCLAFFWAGMSAGRFHALKLSTCLINCDGPNGDMQLRMHFFADDFAAHLGAINGTPITLETHTEQTNELIRDYVNQHFKVSLDGQMQTLRFQTAYKTDIMEYVEFRIPNCSCTQQQHIGIQNSLLTDAFEKQTNLVRLDLKGDKNFKTLRFDQYTSALTYNR